MKPITATICITLPYLERLSRTWKLPNASTSIQHIRIQTVEIWSKVPMTSALCQPKVRPPSCADWVELERALMDTPKPSSSEAMRAGPANKDSEPAISPPMNCAEMKKNRTRLTAIRRFL